MRRSSFKLTVCTKLKFIGQFHIGLHLRERQTGIFTPKNLPPEAASGSVPLQAGYPASATNYNYLMNEMQRHLTIPNEEMALAIASAPSFNIGESMLQGQSYQRRSSEGTNIISFAYLFFE
jgi:hypothetical protein